MQTFAFVVTFNARNLLVRAKKPDEIWGFKG